jgi:hypothetical protein
MYEPYEDIASISPGQITVRGTITHKYAHKIKNGNLMTDVVIADTTGATKVVWFSKAPKNDLVIGSEYIFSGNYQLKYGRLALQSPKYKMTGETPSVDELASSPLVLPVRNYPTKRSSKTKWPEWAGVAVFWGLIVTGVAAYIFFSHSQSANGSNSTDQGSGSNTNTSQSTSSGSSSSQGSTTATTLPSAPSTVTGSHNGIPEIHTPTQSDSNSNCTDVTSYDYDWDDDVLCTRPDGSQFYTNYACGHAVDSAFAG